MNQVIACLYAEFLKIRKSKVLIGTIVAFSLAPVMGALFVIVLRDPVLAAGNSALSAKAALTGFTADWPSFFNLIGQAIGVGGLIIFGFLSSWTFGREYSDHTLKDLLALPVPRHIVVNSKMIAIITWCVFLILFVFSFGLVLGFLLQLPGWSWTTFSQALHTISITSILVILLCTPVTFVACIGKGYLAPLAFVVLSVVFAQIIGALGFGSYFPWAIPAIYSKMIGTQSTLTLTSYLVLIVTSFVGFAGTIYWWSYADHTK